MSSFFATFNYVFHPPLPQISYVAMETTPLKKTAPLFSLASSLFVKPNNGSTAWYHWNFSKFRMEQKWCFRGPANLLISILTTWGP